MVAILLVPQAIAYAYLAGMPPEYGLYASLIPILIYAFLGTSPHLAVGPVAISAILILAGVSKLAKPFSAEYIELTILTGMLIGLVQILAGILKFGKYINLLSYPVITGFTSAASIIIIFSQFKDILRINLPRLEYLHQMVLHLIENIHQTHILTLSIAIFSFFTIFILRRIHRKIPGKLITVSIGIAVSYFFDLASKGVDVIGFVPQGLPAFNVPEISLSSIISLLPIVFIVTIIGFIESIGIAKAIESKHQYYEVNTNKEMIALGTSKFIGAFFSALPSSGSFSRSALLHETKARTTVASIISVLFVAMSLLFLTPLLYYLPKVILAIIIIYAVKNLFEYQLARKLIKAYRFDFVVMLVTFLVTLFISIKIGVATGFLVSLFSLRSQHNSLLKGWSKIITQNYCKEIYFTTSNDKQKSKCLMVNEGLHFGNAYYFKDLIKEEIRQNKSLTTMDIIFNQEGKIDSSASKTIKEVVRMLESKGIKCECSNLDR